jgi:ribosomal protein S13
MLVNIAQKNLRRIKAANFGLSFKELNIASKQFGFPITWKDQTSNTKLLSFSFNLSKAEKSLQQFVLFNSINFNSSLRKRITKRIRVLKVNRTLRGVRHSQFLPVRGQRTKTNARTQKLKRK